MPAKLELFSTGAAADNLGGAHGAAALPSGTVNALWDNVASAEAAAGDVEYRAVDLTNTGGAAATAVKFFLGSLTAKADDGSYANYAGNSIKVGIEASPLASTTALTDESTPPASVTFASYSDLASALALPDIPAGDYCRLFLERTVTAGVSNQNSIRSEMDWDYA
ncbi:MAG: hypothetical protein PF501_09940 [Salinisphaera sp.]|jgi:hypothetical protein|nr:hypothetical protein [Salinisphaera sp.]